jgi:serine protease Do
MYFYFSEILMKKNVASFFKWVSVVGVTAIVVLAIQVNADGDKNQANQAAQSTQESYHNGIVPASLVEAPKQWSPSQGFADLIEAVSPAVVHVAITGTVKSRSRDFPQFNFPPGSPFEEFFKEFQRPEPRKSEKPRKRPLGIGSGFIISEDGYVVTNNHVIKGADEIIVTLEDGEEYEAELEGSDPKTDLALLKLKGAKDLPYIQFGDDEKSRVGDWVLAIGNPFGQVGTATTGIISARGRNINSGPYDNYIQVDAAINRGNSGGPLFNMDGDVIGVNTAIYSPNGGSVGIGFAIPSNQAKNVIAQLKEKGSVERAWIGVQIQPLSDELAAGFGRENNEGALISSVVPDKPADNAGLKAGDIILSFNGEKVAEMRDLPRIVAQSKIGKKLPVTIWRNEKERTLKIKPEPYPSDEALAGNENDNDESDESSSEEASEVIGAQLKALDNELRERLSLDEDVAGVAVVVVDDEGLAAQNGLRRGDVILRVSNQEVSTPDSVNSLIQSAIDANKKQIALLVQRGNGSRFIPFSLEAE